MQIAMLCFCGLIFFYFSVPPIIQYGLLLISFFTLALDTCFSKWQIDRRRSVTYFLLLLLILSLLASTLYSDFQASSYNTSLHMAVMLSLFFLLSQSDRWQTLFLRYSLIASIVHVIATIWQSVHSPSFFTAARLLLSSETLAAIEKFQNQGTYAGLNNQVGLNGFYISIFLLLLTGRLLTARANRIQWLIYMAIGGIALILTGKRGQTVAFFFAFALCFVLLHVYQQRTWGKYVFLAIFLISVVGVLINLLDADKFRSIINQMTRGGESQNFLSGRENLLNHAAGMFRQRPLLGWGTSVFPSLYQNGTHNMYFQLLAENGIIGFTALVGWLTANLKTTLHVMKTEIQRIGSAPENLPLLFAFSFQIFFCLYGLFDNAFHDPFSVLLYVASASLPYSSFKQTNHRGVLYEPI